MQFLKNNKQIFSIVFVLPVFFFYLDRTIILWIRDFQLSLKMFCPGEDHYAREN